MNHTQFWQAVLFGLVEGLTEFLPVSSTGHLILVDALTRFQAIPGNVFEIVIQMGAILAVFLVYRRKLLHVAVNLHRDRSDQRFALNILVAFLPAAVIGVLAHGFIKAYLFNPLVVAVSLIAGGVAIILIENRLKSTRIHSIEEFSPKLALWIGLIQCLAMIPGVSRSGATIMGALLMGADRRAAAEFSFFLAIPTLIGASAYDLYKSWHVLSADGFALIGVGFVASFISAILVVEWMVGFVSRHGFKPFAYYRIVLGAVILALLLPGI